MEHTVSGFAHHRDLIDQKRAWYLRQLCDIKVSELRARTAPRSKFDWPHRAAIVAHDRELAGTGITSVFDALRVGSIVLGNGKPYGKYARRMAGETLQMRDMGAPNLVCGGSHSGNVAAHELAALDRLDILSSDYVPAALLLGAVRLVQIWGNWAKAPISCALRWCMMCQLCDPSGPPGCRSLVSGRRKNCGAAKSVVLSQRGSD